MQPSSSTSHTAPRHRGSVARLQPATSNQLVQSQRTAQWHLHRAWHCVQGTGDRLDSGCLMSHNPGSALQEPALLMTSSATAEVFRMLMSGAGDCTAACGTDLHDARRSAARAAGSTRLLRTARHRLHVLSILLPHCGRAGGGGRSSGDQLQVSGFRLRGSREMCHGHRLDEQSVTPPAGGESWWPTPAPVREQCADPTASNPPSWKMPVPYGPGDGLPCGSRVQAWLGT